jgi:molybdate transport system substrate-binding protein
MPDKRKNRNGARNIVGSGHKSGAAHQILVNRPYLPGSLPVRVLGLKKVFTLVILLVLLLLTPALAETVAAKEEIIVSAAASLTQAMQAVGKAYNAEYNQVDVIFNFGASGSLLQQLAHGAPVDLFLSANQAFMDQAAANNLIRKPSRRDFARNILVLAVAGHVVAKVHRLSDLTQPAVERVAVGHPDTVPAGRYARQALTAAGIWTAIEAKLIFCNSVRQVLDYIRRGEVDAGLVYGSDVRMAKSNVFMAAVVPTRDAIVYCLAITGACGREKAAQHFLDFILGSKGQNVLSEFGFQKIGFTKK